MIAIVQEQSVERGRRQYLPAAREGKVWDFIADGGLQPFPGSLSVTEEVNNRLPLLELASKILRRLDENEKRLVYVEEVLAMEIRRLREVWI